MLIIPLLLTPIAFAGGLWLAAKFAPPLAQTRTGWVAARVVDLLVAAAATAFALSVFRAVRTLTADFEGFSRADALANDVVDGLFVTGLLLGAAAAVHLLAPPPAEADE